MGELGDVRGGGGDGVREEGMVPVVGCWAAVFGVGGCWVEGSCYTAGQCGEEDCQVGEKHFWKIRGSERVTW